MNPIWALAQTISYWSLQLNDIEVLIGIFAFIAISILGIIIFRRDPTSWTHRLFLALSLIFDAYIIANYLSLHPPGGVQNQLFWIRMVMFTAAFKGPLLFLLVHTFPGKKILLPRAYVILAVASMVITALATLTPLVFQSLIFVQGQPIPVQGPGMLLFLLDFVGFLIVSFIILVAKYRAAHDPADKIQQKYLLIGIFTSLALIAASSFISVVILQTSSLVFLGPIFLLFLIASIGYAIVRHQLFNLEIIATNALVVALWLVLLSKIFTARTNIDLAVDSIVFVMILIFGVLLSRSIKREVEQRERLEIVTKELEVTNVKLKELDKLRSEFLSFAAHQVKAPMSIIKGFATLIADGTYGQIPEKVHETAQKIKESSDRLIALVSNLLDLRNIQEGHMEFTFEVVEVRRLLDTIVTEMRELAKKKDLSLTFESTVSDLALNIDQQKFRQVIQNLLDNAIKYTTAGWIKVKLESDPSKRTATISISDSGRGMSADLIPHLFEQFTRDKETAKEISGTGLGLYIAKQIILGHKGTVWVTSDGPGKGSVFFVKLPLP